jgi:hypothetical protein
MLWYLMDMKVLRQQEEHSLIDSVWKQGAGENMSAYERGSKKTAVKVT